MIAWIGAASVVVGCVAFGQPLLASIVWTIALGVHAIRSGDTA